jgi:hypothetical protein
LGDLLIALEFTTEIGFTEIIFFERSSPEISCFGRVPERG